MSTHKKRSLSNVKVSDESRQKLKNEEKIVPAVSNFISTSKSGAGRAVRGMEFLVEPEMCKPWKYHNRDSVWLNPERCADLISSIRKNGQQFPVVARKLENDPDGKAWEIIAGRRRWYACGYLNKQVKVKAFNGDDREAAIVMNLENKDRDDISEFEDAISYKTQLDAGLFNSQEEMAAMLDIKKSKLSKMLAVARVQSYPQIMRLFPDVTKIKINPVYSVLTLIDKSEENKAVIIKKAENLYHNFIKQGRVISSSTCIKELLSSITSSNKASAKRSQKVKHKGKNIFKIQYSLKGDLEILFENKNLTGMDPKEIEVKVLDSLREYITDSVS